MRRAHPPPYGGVAGRRVWHETAPEGVPCASPQTRGRAVDAPQGHGAPRRGRARTGALQDGHRAAARGTPRGPDEEVGRAEGDWPWRGVSRVDGGAIRRRARNGQRSKGRRAEWLAGQVSSGHAAAAACDGKGIRVEGPMPQFVAESDDLLRRSGLPITT